MDTLPQMENNSQKYKAGSAMVCKGCGAGMGGPLCPKCKKNSEIDRVTEELYCAYGSDTGVLFGIPSNLRTSVRAIVKVILSRKK